jgi:hypothetical protein
MNKLIDFNTVGACVGAVRFDNRVQFWCEALDGGVTDSKIITVEFPTEEIAIAIHAAAAYKG